MSEGEGGLVNKSIFTVQQNYHKQETTVLNDIDSILIGVFRVGQKAATHPPKGSHPFFILAPRCRGGCKKIVILHLLEY